jgi:hypothetical protein
MKAFTIVLILVFTLNCSVQSQPTPQRNLPIPRSADYQSKLSSIADERIKLADEYRKTLNKKVVIEKARKALVSSFYNDIVAEWYGTDWDFNGTTETPKVGQIACGYFVSTVLRDAGVRLQRVSMAQQASENIIKSLTTEKFIKRFSNFTIEKFIDDVKKQGEGLYIVGLDVHIGFILHDGENVWFIHSSYGEPSEVVKEKALESVILSSSKYRVTGKISADDNFILKWLKQTAIATVRR